jgi:MFS family permease
MLTTSRLGPVRLMPGVRPRHAACYLWAAFVTIGIFAYLTTLQPYILAVNLHVDPAQRGVISGDLQFWQEVVSVPLFGIFAAWSDRVGRRVVYMLGFLIMAFAYAIYPFATDYGQLLIYRLIYAVGLAALGGMLLIVAADYPVDADRGKLAGAVVFLNSLGALVFLALLNGLPAAYRSAGLSELWAGRGAYLTGACICLLSGLLMIGLRPGRPVESGPKTPITTLLRQGIAAGRRPRIALGYAAAFMARADLVVVALFLSLWVQTSSLADGFTAAQAAKNQGVLFAVVQGCALIWSPIFGWLADRVDRVTLVIIAIVLSAIGYGWVGLSEHPLSSSTFPAAAMLGIGQSSGLLANQVLLGQEAPSAIRGAVIGMSGLIGALGILVISKIGGYAFDHWMPGAPFVIMAIANAVLALFAIFVRMSPARSVAGTAAST